MARKKKKRQSRHGIVAELRQEIIDGVYAPGAQFPTRAELEARYGASSVTIQRAVDCLRREGFLHVEGRQATYVAEYLPNVYHFGMLFNQPPGRGLNSRFYSRLAAAASQYCGTDEDPRRISIYYSVDHDHENREYRELLDAAQAHRLAGIIAPEQPVSTGLADSELGTCPGLARVAFARHTDMRNDWGGVAFKPFTERALDRLAESACRRIAVIGPSDLSHLPEAIAARGMETESYWLHQLALNSAATAASMAQLIFQRHQKRRPDGLFIMDDNLTDHVLRGVVAAGVRVPRDLKIVSHCNFPADPGAVPIQRLGYSAGEAIAACLTELEGQRDGKRPATQWIPARFEEELDEAT